MRRKAVSGIMLSLLLTSILILTFNIQPVKSDWTWTETIYIRADGSVEPDTAPISTVDNITYTLTDNIIGEVPAGSSAIVVERDKIVIDGAGYAIEGTGWRKGIDLEDRINVTIKNMKIKAFYIGIYLISSSNNAISGNIITKNSGGGIHCSDSSNNRVFGNTITANDDHGISCLGSSNNTISGNNIASSAVGISLWKSNGSTFTDNTISENHIGIFLEHSKDNNIYHNNFVDSIGFQVYTENSVNVWDDGYPSGGNYWSDHDCNYNPSDGTQPYIIDENNMDHYPFQDPNGWLLTLFGDLNEDRKVDMRDISLAAAAFGSYPDHPRWNPIADIKQDNKVDMRDLATIARNFGKTV